MGLIGRIIGSLIAVLIVTVIIVGAVLFFLPAEQYARIVARQVEEATGRETLIEGDVRLTVWPELGFRTGAVTVANAEWSSSGAMFRAQGLAVGVDLLTLLGGDLHITRIEAVGPEILLETAPDGQANWEFERQSAATGTASTALQDALPKELALDEAVISGGRITLVDHETDNRVELAAVDLQLRLPDLRGVAEFELRAEMNGQPFAANGSVKDIAAFVAKEVVPVTLVATVGTNRIELVGNTGHSPATFGGRTDAEIADMPAVLALAGIEAPDVPEIADLNATVSGDIALTDSREVKLERGGIGIGDRVEGNRFDLSGVKLSVRLPESGGALGFELETEMNGQTMAAIGEIGDVAAIAGEETAAVSLDLSAAGNRILFEGSSGFTPLAVSGRLDAEIKDMANLLKLSGQQVPALEQMAGSDATLSGDVTLRGTGRFTLGDGRVSYGSREGGERIDLSGFDLSVQLPEPDGKLHFELETEMNGQSISASGAVDGIAALSANGTVPVSLDIAAAGNRIKLEGNAGFTPLTVSGRLESKVTDLSALLALRGLDAPGLQQVVGSNAELSGVISLTDSGEFTLGDGRIAFGDSEEGERIDLSGVDLSVRLPDTGGAADFEIEAVMNGQDFSASGAIRDVPALAGNDPVPVSLRIAAGGNRIGLEGDARFAPFTARGRLTAEIVDMAALLALSGRETSALLQIVGSDASVSGNMTLTESGGFGLNDGRLRLGQNVVTGDVAFRPEERPMLSARLAGDALDLSPLVLAAGVVVQASAVQDEPDTGWPRKPIDVSALQSLDARVSLSVGGLDLGTIKFGTIRTTTNLDAGRTVTEVGELSAFGGSIAGTFVINSRGGLSARANLLGRNIDLKSLLTELADYDRLSARGALEIRLLAIGDSMHELMHSLSGTAALSFGKGEYRGLDLVAALRDLDLGSLGEGRATGFDSLDASFAVNDGVANNDDLILQAPQLFVSGSGRIGIGSRTIDYRAAASLLDENSEVDRSVPLVISGGWDDPKIELDVAEFLRQDLLSKASEIEDQAKEALESKIEEELGSEIEGLDQVEEALKEQLRNRVQDRIINLLGGGN